MTLGQWTLYLVKTWVHARLKQAALRPSLGALGEGFLLDKKENFNGDDFDDGGREGMTWKMARDPLSTLDVTKYE